jgi:DNA-binding transcriptional regulator YdaS (Cro superfamily)
MRLTYIPDSFISPDFFSVFHASRTTIPLRTTLKPMSAPKDIPELDAGFANDNEGGEDLTNILSMTRRIIAIARHREAIRRANGAPDFDPEHRARVERDIQQMEAQIRRANGAPDFDPEHRARFVRAIQQMEAQIRDHNSDTAAGTPSIEPAQPPIQPPECPSSPTGDRDGQSGRK